MQPLGKTILALLVLVAVLAQVGCQKGGDSTPPAAAINSPGDEKATLTAAAAEAQRLKSEQNALHPVYEFETNQGKFLVRLDGEKAPLTVDNFHTYVARGQYDQTIFHQVLKGPLQIVLGGGYTPELKEKAALTPIRNEAHKALKNRRGTIAMARRATAVDSATCQFFFNITDNDALNFKSRTAEGYGYCAFGEVTEGMEVLDRIAKAPVHDSGNFAGLPTETVVIKSVRQVR